MRILIHEPNHQGHRFTTVRVLLDALLALDAQHQCITSITLSSTPEGFASSEFEQQLAPVAHQLTQYALPANDLSRHPFFIARSQIHNLRNLVSGGDFEHIYIPYAGAVLQLLSLCRLWPGCRWWPGLSGAATEVQIMHSNFAYPFTKISRRWFSLLALRYSGCAKVHLNDPLGIEYLNKKHPSLLNHVALLPDPISETTIHDKLQARQTLGLPANARIVGCVGLIDTRKGADVLIKAFDAARLQSTDTLVLAGRLAPEVATLLKSIDNPNIVVFDRYISDEELSQTLCASDLIATPYPQVVGSASIIIRAAIAKRMVLTNNTGWAQYIVNRFKLGLTAPSNNIEMFTRALEQAMQQASSFEPDRAALQFTQFNDIDNIHAHWTSFIRKRLGLEQDKALRSWTI